MSKEDKEFIVLMEKRAKALIRNLGQDFLNRHLRNPAIRRWRMSLVRLVRLNKVAQAVSVDRPRNFNMDIFIPPQIRAFSTLLDELNP